jgi:hypothetical protein
MYMSGTYKSKPSQFFNLIRVPVFVSLCGGGGGDGGGVGTFYFPECFSGQFNGVSERKCC